MGDKQCPALHGASRRTRRARCPQQTPAPAAKQLPGKDGRKQHAKAGERPQALPFAFPQGARSLLHLGSATGRSMDGTPSAPVGAATQHGHSIPSVPGTFALPFTSSLVFFHTITLSSIDAIIFPHVPPAPLLPPPLVREFFGPRDPVFSGRQETHHALGTVGESRPVPRPLPSTQMGKKTQKKSEKTQPTACLSNAPRFFVH